MLLMLQDERTVEPLTYGRIASYYYLKHQSVGMFKERLRAELLIPELLSILTVSVTPHNVENTLGGRNSKMRV